MAAQGYVKLFRKVARHPDWDNHQFDPGKAWIDLLLMARWKGQQRGQLATTGRTLAKRWGWSWARVKRQLTAWEKAGQLSVAERWTERATGRPAERPSNGASLVLTIINWGQYQSDGAPGGAPGEARGGAHKEEGNKKEAHKKAHSARSADPRQKELFDVDAQLFDRFWRAVPRKVAKKRAKAAFGRVIRELAAAGMSEEQAGEFLSDRMTAFAASPKGQSGQFCPYPATWLNDGRYDDDPETWQRASATDRMRPPERDATNGATPL